MLSSSSCSISGEFRGCTGQALTDVVAIGIGGSYLGAEFVAEALHTDPKAQQAAAGRRLTFLANVDPVAISRALEGSHTRVLPFAELCHAR